MHHFDRAVRVYGDPNKKYTVSQWADMKQQFRKNKHFVLQPNGFDEYYLLKDDSISEEEDDFDNVVVKSTNTRSIVSAFNKFNKGRLESRVVLNRFIDLIS
jgi:hypothetical protein